jgi:hypothetical protein
MSKTTVRINGKAFYRKAVPSDGRYAEYAIRLLVGRHRAMVGVSAPTNAAAKKVLKFLGLEVFELDEG